MLVEVAVIGAVERIHHTGSVEAEKANGGDGELGPGSIVLAG
jgi:hypothetical protein